jgi:hypothetical protein
MNAIGKKIYTLKNGVIMITFRIVGAKSKKFIRTYTSPDDFHNYPNWSHLKEGDHVKGLVWVNEEEGIIDGDSPVEIL